MADKHRHPHTGRRQLDGGIQNLLGFRHHLPFFLGPAVIHEVIDVGDNVKGDLLGENLLMLGCRLVDENAFGLIEQLIHVRLTAAGRGLVGRHHDA